MSTTSLAPLFVALAAVGAPSAFDARVESDPTTGLEVVVLRYTPADAPESALAAKVLPGGGANLFSFSFGGEELLAQGDLADVAQGRTGTPVLFPSPNRVKDATFTFGGRTFTFTPNNGKNFIHGLVRNRAFAFDPPRADARGAEVKTRLAWTEEQPDFDRFPIPHVLTITYRLERDGLRIAYEVVNTSKEKLPFGFALHPYFRIPGERKDVFVRVPAPTRMEAVEKLPTGKLVPVAGTPYDLRKPVSLEGLDLDDVYFGITPQAPPAFEWRDKGIGLSFAGTKDFTHLVIFTPPGRAFFCLENQTASTDAHNLHAQGRVREAHLQIVAPGKKASGHVFWRPTRLPPPPETAGR